MEIVGIMLVFKLIYKIVMVSRGRGMFSRMKNKNGEISGMLEVSVYVMDFFKLLKIKRFVKEKYYILF